MNPYGTNGGKPPTHIPYGVSGVSSSAAVAAAAAAAAARGMSGWVPPPGSDPGGPPMMMRGPVVNDRALMEHRMRSSARSGRSHVGGPHAPPSGADHSDPRTTRGNQQHMGGRRHANNRLPHRTRRRGGGSAGGGGGGGAAGGGFRPDASQRGGALPPMGGVGGHDVSASSSSSAGGGGSSGSVDYSRRRRGGGGGHSDSSSSSASSLQGAPHPSASGGGVVAGSPTDFDAMAAAMGKLPPAGASSSSSPTKGGGGANASATGGGLGRMDLSAYALLDYHAAAAAAAHHGAPLHRAGSSRHHTGSQHHHTGSSHHHHPPHHGGPPAGSRGAPHDAPSATPDPDVKIVNRALKDEEKWSALYLSHKKLSSVSPQLSYYPFLTELHLNGNLLTRIPDTLYRGLSSLKILDLSHNRLSSISPSIGNLVELEDLRVSNNMIVEIPYAIGKLYRLKAFAFSHNPIKVPSKSVLEKTTKQLVMYMRDRMPLGPRPPARTWVSPGPLSANHAARDVEETRHEYLRAMCYNVLSDKLALPSMFTWVPSQYLNWDHRKLRLLEEVQSYHCDLIALQEVEGESYEAFFKPKMAEIGYDGLYKPKSRARTMRNYENVDGCVIFYKKERFDLVEDFWIEYQSGSIERYEAEFPGESESLDRLITRDQIAIAAIFKVKNASQVTEVPRVKGLIRTDSGNTRFASATTSPDGADESSPPKDGPSSSSSSSKDPDEQLLMVVNTHIHWDPAYSDVKLMQTIILLEELAKLTQGPDAKYPGVPVLICGDLNSLPNSGVLQLLKDGRVDGNHPEFLGSRYGRYTEDGMEHKFHLNSAYHQCLGHEPEFTNYNGQFKGCLDYLMFTRESLTPHRVLLPPDESVVHQHAAALPNAYMCSDHVPILADFKIKARK